MFSAYRGSFCQLFATHITKKGEKSLDKSLIMKYNKRAAILKCNEREVHDDGKNISAQEASEIKGTRLQKENEYCQRKKGVIQTPCKRQSKTQRLTIKQNHRCRHVPSVFFVLTALQ